jgi:hypothetical protein
VRRCLLALCLAVSLPAAAGSFEAHHPDQYYFKLGAAAWEAGRYEAAAERMREAARYADKPAQLALALMARDGLGRPPDLAEAYAWADLAAERGYRVFLLERERLWARLDEAGRERAVEIGTKLYAEYGDAVAKPRLERLLRSGRAQKTGSRTGSATAATGTMSLSDPAARAMLVASMFGNNTDPLDASNTLKAFSIALGGAADAGANAYAGDYYAEENWEPKAYWQARDAVWRRGTVEVKPLKKAGDAAQ